MREDEVERVDHFVGLTGVEVDFRQRGVGHEPTAIIPGRLEGVFQRSPRVFILVRLQRPDAGEIGFVEAAVLRVAFASEDPEKQSGRQDTESQGVAHPAR